MKKLWFLICLFASSVYAQSASEVLKGVYGVHRLVCTQTAVASTGTNRVGPVSTTGLYVIYGYTSSSDFTGIAIKCLQGESGVTVNGVQGIKLSAGEKQIWTLTAGEYVSCQTGSGSGVYDLCPIN